MAYRPGQGISLEAVRGFQYIQAERDKIRGEVSKLERKLNEFVNRGDIRQTHHHKSMALLNEFVENGGE